MMGAGKSSLAKKLASAANWQLIDLDKVIEQSQGASISEIFEKKGEESFRLLERAALMEAMRVDEAIISVGGGAPCFYDNETDMKKSGLCVWLDAPIALLANRLINAKEIRPLVMGLNEEEIIEKLDELYAKRSSFYASAHMILSVNKMSVQESTRLLTSIIQDKS